MSFFAAEPKMSAAMTPEKLVNCVSDPISPSARHALLAATSAADDHLTHCLIPENRCSVLMYTVK